MIPRNRELVRVGARGKPVQLSLQFRECPVVGQIAGVDEDVAGGKSRAGGVCI
jgi:hypothetical protein